MQREKQRNRFSFNPGEEHIELQQNPAPKAKNRISFKPEEDEEQTNLQTDPEPGPSSSQPRPNAPPSHTSRENHNISPWQASPQPQTPPKPTILKRFIRSLAPPTSSPTSETSDPNDPHNWPLSQKLTTYTIICLFTFLSNINASCFTVALLPLSKQFNVDRDRAAWFTNFNVLAFGLGNLIWVPLMRVVGKRPVYLAAILVLVGSNIWSANSRSYGSLLASRVMSGIGASAADATVPSVVFDMFEKNQRAWYMSWFHIALASGIFLGPVINAYVIQEHGWWWIPGWMAIGFGAIFWGAVFGIFETSFEEERRGKKYESGNVPRKLGYRQRLGLTLGMTKEKKGEVFLKTLLRLFQMAGYVPVIYAGVGVGVFVGATIIIQFTVGQWLTTPPYRWKIGKAGLFHFSGWVGALFALWFGGRLVDLIVERNEHERKPWLRWLCRRLRDGPERRLVGLVIPAALAPPGLLIYGFEMAKRGSPIAPGIGYVMHSFGFTAVANVLVTYLVDCYRQLTAEAMVTLFIIRNLIATFISFYASSWVENDGAKAVFGTIAGVEWGVMLAAVLVYFFNGLLLNWSKKWGPYRDIPHSDEEESRPTAGAADLESQTGADAIVPAEARSARSQNARVQSNLTSGADATEPAQESPARLHDAGVLSNPPNQA